MNKTGKGCTLISECETGDNLFLANLTSHTCKPCSVPCATCTGNIENCLTCVDGYNYNGTHCIAICADGFYPKDGKCEPCLSGFCTKCFGPSKDECYECEVGKYLEYRTCDVGCPDGKFKGISAKGGECLPCDFSCKTCAVDAVTCLTCDTSYPRFMNLLNNKCVINCPVTYYKDFVTF